MKEIEPVRKYQKSYSESVAIKVDPGQLFEFADNHMNFASHMNKSSWMMGGGKMETILDSDNGQKVGSHIKMKGNAFGFSLSLDEVVTKRIPPRLKEWETIGEVKLVVIGQYKLGFEIEGKNGGSEMKVFIEFDESGNALGRLFGNMYAKWCVRQMTEAVKQKYN